MRTECKRKKGSQRSLWKLSLSILMPGERTVCYGRSRQLENILTREEDVKKFRDWDDILLNKPQRSPDKEVSDRLIK